MTPHISDLELKTHTDRRARQRKVEKWTKQDSQRKVGVEDGMLEEPWLNFLHTFGRPCTDDSTYFLGYYGPGYDTTDFKSDDTVLAKLLKPDYHHYPPYPGEKVELPEPQAVQQAAGMARSMANQVIADSGKLMTIVRGHEHELHRVWQAKAPKQRQELLLKAVSLPRNGVWNSKNLPMRHRPETYVSVHSCSSMPLKPMQEPAIAVPHINIEDLCQTDNLLVFLNARGNDHPWKFAYRDLLNCGVATRQDDSRCCRNTLVPINDCRRTPDLGFRRLPGYGMRLLYAESAEEYSRIVEAHSFADRAEWEKWAESSCSVEQGMCVLQIQILTYDFLYRICLVMLSHLRRDPSSTLETLEQLLLDTERFPPREPCSQSLIGSMHLPSVSCLLRTANYKKPCRLDFSLLDSLTSARASTAEDHLCALRSDPSYFRDTVTDESRHSPLLVPLPSGRLCSDVLDGKGTKFFWTDVLRDVIYYAHMEAVIWPAVSKKVAEAKDIYAQNEDRLLRTYILPDNLRQCLTELYSIVQVTLSILKKQLFRTSLGWFQSSHNVHENIGKCTDYPVDTNEDNTLALLFFKLGYDSRGHRLFRDWVIADIVQGTIDTNECPTKQPSGLLAGRFNDWATLTELDRQLKNLFPWANVIQTAAADPDTYSREAAQLFRDLENFRRRTHVAASKVAEPNFLRHGRFKYPSHSRRSRKTVQEMREAENDLQTVWTTVDDYYLRKKKKPIHEFLDLPYMVNIRVLETKPWTDEDTVSAPKSQARCSVAVWDLEYRTEKTIQAVTPGLNVVKLKQKTRSGSQVVRENENELIAKPTSGLLDQQSMQTITVDKRSYEILTTLFFSTETSKQRTSSIPWMDFCNAMIAANFTVRKLWGSVWHFSPLNARCERSIQFHDPHPSSRLDFKLARRFGRRLHRAYGWTYETFVQKESD